MCTWFAPYIASWYRLPIWVLVDIEVIGGVEKCLLCTNILRISDQSELQRRKKDIKTKTYVHESFLSAVPDLHALRVAWLQPDSFTFNWQLASRPNALTRSDWHHLLVEACVIRSVAYWGSHYHFNFFISIFCSIVICTNVMSVWNVLFFFNLHIYAPSVWTLNKKSGKFNLAGHDFFHNNLLQISTLLHSLLCSTYAGSTTDCAHKR